MKNNHHQSLSNHDEQWLKPFRGLHDFPVSLFHHDILIVKQKESKVVMANSDSRQDARLQTDAGLGGPPEPSCNRCDCGNAARCSSRVAEHAHAAAEVELQHVVSSFH